MAKKPIKRAQGPNKFAFALSNPNRLAILDLLGEVGVSSPKRMSEQLDASLNLISYHIKVLLECEAVRFVEKKQRRGAWEHFYERTISGTVEREVLSKIPPALRDFQVIPELREFVKELLRSIEAGHIEPSDLALGSMTILVDERGQKQAAELREEVMAEFRSLNDKCEQRAKVSDEELTRMVVSIAAFNSNPPA